MIVGITIAIAPGNQGLIILAPLIALVGILILFLGRLTREDGRLPIADIGSFYVLAIFAYGAIPLLFHLLSGMQLTVLSHDRLLSLDPPPIEYALVGWLHVVFMATFILTYISIRKANPFLEGKALVVTKNTLKVLLLMWLMFEGYFLYLKLFMGINFSTAYDSSLYENAAAYAQLGILEALAHKTAVLISPRCFFPEVEKFGAGMISAPNVEALEKSLRTLLSHPKSLDLMGERGHKLVASQYTWANITDMMIDAYEEGINRFNSRRDAKVREGLQKSPN